MIKKRLLHRLVLFCIKLWEALLLTIELVNLIRWDPLNSFGVFSFMHSFLFVFLFHFAFVFYAF